MIDHSNLDRPHSLKSGLVLCQGFFSPVRQSLQDELQNPFPTLEDTLTVLLEHDLLFNLEVQLMLLLDVTIMIFRHDKDFEGWENCTDKIPRKLSVDRC